MYAASVGDYFLTLFSVGKVVWFIMVLHIVAACIFLLLGTLATGDTRREVCEEGQRCKHCNVFGKLAQISVSRKVKIDIISVCVMNIFL